MAKRRSRSTLTAITSMRLSPKLMQMALKKANKLGLSRTQYIDQLIRKDLGVDGVDLETINASVFG